MSWPGLVWKACFLALSMLHFEGPGIKASSSVFEWSVTKSDRMCCLVYQLVASSYEITILVTSESLTIPSATVNECAVK